MMGYISKEEMNKAIEEKDEKINMLDKEINKKDNQLKEKEQKIAALQSILQEIPKQPLNDNKKKELFEAVKNNNIKKVKMFLYAYKDVVNARNEDDYQKTAFLVAAQSGQLAIAKLLKQRGADMHAKDERGNNALKLAQAYTKDSETINWLLQNIF